MEEVNITVTETIEQVTIVVSEAINGLSAYELAVKNGYVGTEIQWLASLGGLGNMVVGQLLSGTQNGDEEGIGNYTFTTSYQMIPESTWVVVGTTTYLNGLQYDEVLTGVYVTGIVFKEGYAPTAIESIRICGLKK